MLVPVGIYDSHTQKLVKQVKLPPGTYYVCVPAGTHLGATVLHVPHQPKQKGG